MEWCDITWKEYLKETREALPFFESGLARKLGFFALESHFTELAR